MAVHAGQSVKIGDSQISILAPVLPFLEGTCDDVNNNGIVFSVVTGKSKLIITGDSQEEQWDSFDAKQLEATSIFLASHHGRESGYSQRILKIMRPQRIIISDGIPCDTDATAKYELIAPVSTTRNNNVVVSETQAAVAALR